MGYIELMKGAGMKTDSLNVSDLALSDAQTPPLSCWADGSLRVGNSRIPAERVIYAYSDGDTPEEIKQDFPSLSLSEIYSVLAFYLRHKDEIDAYIQRRQSDATKTRQEIGAPTES